MMTQKIKYIHNNPVKRGLVTKAEDLVNLRTRIHDKTIIISHINCFQAFFLFHRVASLHARNLRQ